MKKNIPNIITCLNLVSGTMAVVLTLWGHFTAAFLFMIAAACFDFLDGTMARLLKTYSDTGKELDSLADVVSFGLVPALMLFTWYYKINTGYPSFAAFIALLIVPFSALRLAKFNLDKRQTTDFLGMPTPAVAMLVGSAVSYATICRTAGTTSIVTSLLCTRWFIPSAAVILSLLLISEIPMFSMKHKTLSFKQSPTESIFMFSPLIIIPIASHCAKVRNFTAVASLGIMLFFALYLLLNLCRKLLSVRK